MDRIELIDKDIARIIAALTTTRDYICSLNYPSTDEASKGIQETLSKIVKHVGPSTFGGTLTLNAGQDEDNPQFALWFTPAAIRDHFDEDDSEIGKAVEAADDQTLAAIGDMAIGDMAINGDSVYRGFHDELVYCAAYILLGKDT